MGAGGWRTGWSASPPWAGVGDFNGDGKDDLVVSNAANNTYNVATSTGAALTGPGTGTWLTGWNPTPAWAGVG